MVVLVRVTLMAAFGAAISILLWWILVQFGEVVVIPNFANVPMWHVGIVGALIGGSSEAWRIAAERRRRRMNRAIAAESGFEFAEQIPPAEIRSLDGISIFRKDSIQGHDRISGVHQDRQMEIFDLYYTETSQGPDGSTTSKFLQTVYRFPTAAQGLPSFRVAPRRRMTGLLTHLFGTTELELLPPENADQSRISVFERFRKQYQVVPDAAVNPTEMQRKFHPLVIGWLSLHLGWSMESNGTNFVAWKTNVTVAGGERLRMLNELGELLTLMSASDQALKQSTPAQIQVHTRDRARGLSGCLGLWLGMMIGTAVGGALGAVVLSQLFAGNSEGAPPFSVIVSIFFGSSILFAALGGLFGSRFGRRSEWARRMSSQMDSFRGCAASNAEIRGTFKSANQEANPNRHIVPSNSAGPCSFTAKDRTFAVGIDPLNCGKILSTPLPPRIIVDGEILILKMLRGMRLLGTCMLVVGVVALSLAVFGHNSYWPGQAVAVCALSGSTMTLAGILMLLLPSKHHFDRTEGTHVRASWIASKRRPLDEIVAVQVVSGGTHKMENENGGGPTVNCYQLNLVLDGSPCRRENLASIPDRQWIFDSGSKLAEFLDVPIIDVTDTN